jgi:hypothetical protein
MRTTKELLELTLRGMDNGLFRKGLCGLIDRLRRENFIGLEEWYHLSNYINQNSPKKTYDYMWYWKPGNKKPRIKWLKKHIELMG